jgi:hypothetical protein
LIHWLIISLIHYLSSAVKSVVERKSRLTFRIVFVLIMLKCGYLQICLFVGLFLNELDLLGKIGERDGVSSMSIFSSHVSMNIFWLSVLEIIATQNDNFWCVLLDRKKESKLADKLNIGTSHLKERKKIRGQAQYRYFEP